MTARSDLFSDIIEKQLELIGGYRRSIGKDADPGTLNALSHCLTNLEHSLREKMQEETREAMVKVVKALEHNSDLSAADKDLIRIWMVGDAEFYTNVENNFGDWTAELNRLLDVIAGARGKTLSPAQMTELGAKVRDALRTSADVQFYQEQRARLARFRTATADWSLEDKKILARMLRSKLESNEA